MKHFCAFTFITASPREDAAPKEQNEFDTPALRHSCRAPALEGCTFFHLSLRMHTGTYFHCFAKRFLWNLTLEKK